MTTKAADLDIKVPEGAEPRRIRVADIRPSSVALRGVNQQDPQFIELVDSVRTRGVLLSVLVRELKDSDTGDTYYGLIDGLQRYTASQIAGLEYINANVVTNMSDAQVLETQIVTNAIRVETRPVDFSNQLVRIFNGDPTMSLADMAAKLNRSISWVSDRLGLAKLTGDIAELVNNGRIPLANAYVLAKMPEEHRETFVQQAMSMSATEFAPTANARIKELKAAKREGRDPNADTFVAVVHFQKMPDVQAEAAQLKAFEAYEDELANAKPAQVWALALQWVLHQDPKSIEAARAKHDQKKKELADAKEKRAAERKAAKDKLAAETAAAVTA